jgi:hypothetical protein
VTQSRILRFKITVLQVLGPCNLIGVQRLLSRHTASTSDVLWRYPASSSKSLITMNLTTRCPNPDHTMNPHCPQHLQSCTKEHQQELKYGYKCCTGKLNYSETVCFLQTCYWILCTFLTTAYRVFHILPVRGWNKDTKLFLVTDIISINTHFRVRNTYYDMTQTTTHSK